MKMCRAAFVACVCGVCLTLTQSTWASPAGVVVQEKNIGDNQPPGTRTCNVYIHFDDSIPPGEGVPDNLLAISFTQINTDDPTGFFQVPAAMFGSDLAPLEILLPIFPVLEADSYVTIGLKIVPLGGPGDATSLDPPERGRCENLDQQTLRSLLLGAFASSQHFFAIMRPNFVNMRQILCFL